MHQLPASIATPNPGFKTLPKAIMILVACMGSCITYPNEVYANDAATAAATAANHDNVDVRLSIPTGEEQTYREDLQANVTEIRNLVEKGGGFLLLVNYPLFTNEKAGIPDEVIDKVEKAIERREFEGIQEMLEAASLMITLNKHGDARSISIHPFQAKNSAYYATNAVNSGDLEALKKILQNSDGSLNKPVFSTAAVKETALEVAIRIQDVPSVKALLEAKVDTEISGRGTSPLSRAVIFKNLDIIELLLDAGADMNARLRNPTHSSTLLGYSVETGNSDLLVDLIERGADANIGDSLGWTPLMHAVRSKNWEMIEQLLPISDPNILSTSATTAYTFDDEAERQYPICNALFIAEQIDTADGEKIREALAARAAELGTSTDNLLPTLSSLRSEIELARKRYKVADAMESTDKGLNLLKLQKLSEKSDSKLVNHAIWFVLFKHELMIASGSNLDSEDRTFNQLLIDLGSMAEKWHDTMDLFHTATTEDPAQAIASWQQTHGKPNRKDWNYDLLDDWIASVKEVEVQDRLYTVLDFFELN